jgi:glycosyl transferase family 87
MNCLRSASEPHRAFKLVFVPLLIFSLLVQAAVVWTQLEDIRRGYFDFVLYYSGAQIIADGNGARLYDLGVQREYQQKVRAVSSDRDLPFNHLPYELVALLIPAKFSFSVAHLIWAGMNIVLLATILVRMFPFVEPNCRSLFALMLFGFFPTITALKMGQDSILTTFLLVETFVSLKRNHYIRAGGFLALGLYKPQFVLPLVGILFLRRRWYSVFSFLAGGLLVGAISLYMVGWDGLVGLVSLWLPMVHRGNVVWPELMLNLRGLVYMILDLVGFSAATNPLTLALSILGYGMTVRLWRATVDENDRLFDLSFALAVVTTALVSFHLYSYDGTLLVIPLAIMLNEVLKNSDHYPVLHRIFLAILLTLFFPLVPNVLLSSAILAWWTLPLPILFGVIAMTIWNRFKAECPGSECLTVSAR